MGALLYYFVLLFIFIVIFALLLGFLFLAFAKKKSRLLRIVAVILMVIFVLVSWKVFLVNYELMSGEGSGEKIEKSYVENDQVIENIKDCKYASMSFPEVVRNKSNKVIGYIKFEKKPRFQGIFSIINPLVPIQKEFANPEGYPAYVTEIEREYDSSGCTIWYTSGNFSRGQDPTIPVLSESERLQISQNILRIHQESIDKLNNENAR